MSDSEITDFKIEIPDAQLEDLRRRLGATRWPDAETVDDWSQGIPLAYVQEVCAYWAEKYDWREREAALNRFAQFKTSIDGCGIHFIHVRSPHEDALPIVITHGWPGSVVEFHKVIEPSPTRRPTVATRPTPSTWCAPRCPATASRTGPLIRGGGWRTSRMPGRS